MTAKQAADFRRQLAVLVLEAAVSACNGVSVARLNAELARRWALVVAAGNLTAAQRLGEDR